MTRPFDSGEREPQLKATREKTTAERTDDARRHFFQVWMVIGAAVLIYMFGFVLDVLSLPVAIIVWTIVFVLVLRSPVDALERRGVRRGLGTTIAFAGMFAVLAALAVIMFSPIFGVNDQFANIFSALPVYVQGLIDWANSFYDRYASLLQDDTVRGWIGRGLEVARRLGVICRETVGQWRGAVWHGHRECLRRFGFCACGGVLDAYGIALDRSRGRSIGAR